MVDGLLGKVGNYTAPDLIQAFCLLMLAYLLTFLTFDQSENITIRPWKRELKISVKFNLILTLINSAGLLLTKAPLLSSRYFLVAVPVINVVLMTVFHSVLKKLLTTTRKKNSMESLVGVVTTGEDAGAMVRELQRDWSKRLTGHCPAGDPGRADRRPDRGRGHQGQLRYLYGLAAAGRAG